MATAFNDCEGGVENRSSRFIRQQRRIDRGRPADEITSEERRYGRTNEPSVKSRSLLRPAQEKPKRL